MCSTLIPQGLHGNPLFPEGPLPSQAHTLPDVWCHVEFCLFVFFSKGNSADISAGESSKLKAEGSLRVDSPTGLSGSIVSVYAGPTCSSVYTCPTADTELKFDGLYFCLFSKRVSLRSFGCPGSHWPRIHRDLPASASQILGLRHVPPRGDEQERGRDCQLELPHCETFRNEEHIALPHPGTQLTCS